jgi:hypothetical protein
LQQEAMYDRVRAALLGAAAPSAAEAARANVDTYGKICRAAFAEAAVATLLAAMEKSKVPPSE